MQRDAFQSHLQVRMHTRIHQERKRDSNDERTRDEQAHDTALLVEVEAVIVVLVASRVESPVGHDDGLSRSCETSPSQPRRGEGRGEGVPPKRAKVAMKTKNCVPPSRAAERR